MILVLAVGEVKAVSYSPSSLIFNLNMGEEGCQMITINSDSETIGVFDNWAEKKEMEWKANSFNTSSNYHSIIMNYPRIIYRNEKQAKICMRGYKPGEYHGILLLKEEQRGNSIIQMGIWLKARINGNESAFKPEKNQEAQKPASIEIKQAVKSTDVDLDKEQITGNVAANMIEDNKNNSRYYWIIGIIAVLVIGLIMFNKMKSKKIEYQLK